MKEAVEAIKIYTGGHTKMWNGQPYRAIVRILFRFRYAVPWKGRGGFYPLPLVALPTPGERGSTPPLRKTGVMHSKRNILLEMAIQERSVQAIVKSTGQPVEAISEFGFSLEDPTPRFTRPWRVGRKDNFEIASR